MWYNYILASKTHFKETHFRFKDKNRVKVKGWKITRHTNSNRNTVVTAVSDKTDFMTRIGIPA